jgi:uncharacterized protein
MIYLDTSALVKLVVEEEESRSLERWLVYQELPIVTSVIGKMELVRACRRMDPVSVSTAYLLLADLPLVPLTGSVLETAENIGPPALRSLDALHLASAFHLGDALTSFVTYDKRLRDAAVLTDLRVMNPGTD